MSISKSNLKLLAIDDTPADLDLIRDALASEDVQVFTASSAEIGLERFIQLRPRIVLSDLFLPGMNGLELLDRILGKDPGANVVLVTAYYSTDSAVQAIRQGAHDYLPKPLDIERLRRCVRDLAGQDAVRQRTLLLDNDLVDAFQFESMIGRSPLMLDVFAKIRRIVEELGYQAATPAEARQMLGLKGADKVKF